MRTLALVIFCLLFSFCIGACAEKPFTRATLAELQTEEMPAFTPPQVREEKLACGATVFLLEDHELPIINIGIIARAGSIYEPPDKLGLAGLAALSMRDGGTEKLAPDLVDEAVDDNAVDISFSAGREMFSATLGTLSSKFPATLDLFFDLLLHPRFDEGRIEINRLKLIDQLKRDEDNPEIVAARDFNKLVYGDASPWARQPVPADIAGLTRDDAVAFWQRFIKPRNFLIAATGDFKSDELIAKLEKLMADVFNDEIVFPGVAPVQKSFDAATEYIKRDLTQAYIYTGHLGIKRTNPDKFALQVMNTVLGGGSFKSRLSEDIRTTRGLAYSVWSHFGWGTDYGLFRVYAATKAANEKEVLLLIDQEVADLADTGIVTTDELSFAKDAVLGRLIFEFDNSYKIASSQAHYRFNGYPPNYWTIYRDGIKAVEKPDVERVAHEYLHPDAMKTLIVGPAH